MENMNYQMGPGMGAQAAQPAPGMETKKKAAGPINIKELLQMMALNWIWFVVSIVIFLASGLLYVHTLQPVYERMSDIEIKAAAHAGDEIRAVVGLEAAGSSVNIGNELYIFRSYKVAREVADKVHLDVRYYRQGQLRRLYLSDDRPFSVTFLTKFTSYIRLCLRPTSAQTFQIMSVERDGVLTELPKDVPPYFFGSPLRLPDSEEEIQLDVSDSNYPALMSSLDQDVYVERISLDEAAANCQAMVTAEKQTGSVIRLTCHANSVGEADNVLRVLTRIYNQHSLEQKNASIVNSAKFIEERIEQTARDLSEAEQTLNSVGVRFDKTGAAISAASSKADNTSQRLEARSQYDQVAHQLALAQEMSTQVQNAIVTKDYIPMLSGLNEAGASGAVTAYNAAIQQRNRLLANSSADNPAVRRIDDNLGNLTSSILSAVNSYIATSKMAARSAATRLAGYSGAAAASEKALEGFDSAAIANKSLAITHEYKQKYFQYLLERREDIRLQLAVSNADTRVIEDPMGSTMPIYPVPMNEIVKFVGVGAALPALVMLIVALLTTTVRGRKDVEDALTIPFMGELPEAMDAQKESVIKERIKHYMEYFKRHKEEKKVKSNKIVITHNIKTPLAEAFHIVQSNLSYMRCEDTGQRPQVIMFTSFAPGAGKSFVSVNMASSLATSPTRRCIWIDMDIRKGHRNQLLLPENKRVRRPVGLSNYLAGKAELEQCIFRSAENEHLDIMLAGPVPPNPVQLLTDEKLDNLITMLREKYEYIIIDSVPAAVVADAVICNRLADLTVYVVRVGKTERSHLPEVEKIYQQKRFKNLCCVLNGASLARRRYAYGYGSGYGYTYGYGSGYGYGYGSAKMD